MLSCTNDFRSKELAVSPSCWRYDRLIRRNDGKLAVKDVAEMLHSVNQRSHTLQAMIFEPADMKMHVAIGKAPVTARPMKKLQLHSLFGAE